MGMHQTVLPKHLRGSGTAGAPATTGDTKEASEKPKRAKVKTGSWRAQLQEIGQQTNHYNGANGKPNPYHMLAAAHKEGFSEITNDNVEAVVKRLLERAGETDE